MFRRSFQVGWLLFIVAACGGNVPAQPDSGSAGGTGSAGKAAATGGMGAVAGAGASAGAPNGGSGNTGSGGAITAGSGGATAGSGGASTINHPEPQSSTASWVFLDGYQLFVGKRSTDGSLATPTPYKIKGISWSPTGVGESNDAGYAGYYTQYRGQDAPLIENLHANTVKTYDPFETTANGTAVLNDLYSRGVMVVMNVMAAHGVAEGKGYLSAVNYFKGHPAILMWLVGNEFNYNNLYGAGSYDAALNLVNTAVNDIHNADPDHPVAVSFGEVPTLAQYNQIPNADVWSINIYPGLDFGARFNNWINLSKKPMFIGEYGADAYNSNSNAEDQAAQATAVQDLTSEIQLQYSADNASHGVLGGTPYSLTDEWWKDGNDNNHDNGGFAGAIHPDNFANEEWWGLCTIQRTPRSAYNSLAGLYAN